VTIFHKHYKTEIQSQWKTLGHHTCPKGWYNTSNTKWPSRWPWRSL